MVKSKYQLHNVFFEHYMLPTPDASFNSVDKSMVAVIELHVSSGIICCSVKRKNFKTKLFKLT